MVTFQQFPEDELNDLRDELRDSGLDCFQAAELVYAFLIGRGYGVSTADARTVASRIDSVGTNLPKLQLELERIALVM